MKGYSQGGMKKKGTKLIRYSCGCIYQWRYNRLGSIDFVSSIWCMEHAMNIWKRFRPKEYKF